MSKPKLGYWGVKGRGQQLRLFLTYLKVDFEDVRYGGPNAPDWFKQDKFGLGFEFPNLPYFIDGDQKVTETLAVYKYIANRFNHKETLGKTWQEEVQLDMVFGVVEDCISEFQKLVYSTDDKAAYEKILSDESKFAQKLAQLDKFIGNKDTYLGYLTFEDFHTYGLLNLTSIVSKHLFGQSAIKKYKGLEALYQHIKKIGADYLSKPENKLPFLPPHTVKVNVMEE